MGSTPAEDHVFNGNHSPNFAVPQGLRQKLYGDQSCLRYKRTEMDKVFQEQEAVKQAL